MSCLLNLFEIMNFHYYACLPEDKTTHSETSWDAGSFSRGHLQGIYGAPWVEQLQRRLRRECVNFGRCRGSKEGTLLIKGYNERPCGWMANGANESSNVASKTSTFVLKNVWKSCDSKSKWMNMNGHHIKKKHPKMNKLDISWEYLEDHPSYD